MKLIDKDKIDEILRNLWKEDDGHNPEHRICYNKELQEVQCEIDTLEIKEVDLNEEIKGYFKGFGKFPSVGIDDCIDIAKYFFELGLKTNQENNVIGILERVVKIDAGGYPYIDCDIEFYDYDKDIPLAKEGDKVKVVVVKGK